MKRPGLFLVLMFAPFLLTACPPPSYLTVFNNTGETIEVRSGRDKDIIAGGRSDRFDFPTRDEVFRLSGGGCEYLYDFSAKLGDYYIDRTLLRGIQIQAENDFSINLLPASYKGDTPASADMILKQETFPLRPVSRKCASAPKP